MHSPPLKYSAVFSNQLLIAKRSFMLKYVLDCTDTNGTGMGDTLLSDDLDIWCDILLDACFYVVIFSSHLPNTLTYSKGKPL